VKWRQRSYCGEIVYSHAGKEVLLMGWVDAIRDHGQLLFIHLRDASGIVQVVFDPDIAWETYDQAGELREEYIIQVTGRVAARERGTENPHLKTGDVEVFAEEMTILSASKSLPFQLSEKAMVFGEEIARNPGNVDEELRLQYRYLDLRRPSMQHFLTMRYQVIKCIRDCLHQRNFIEVETPLLTQSTPEGARDFLVPSRLHEGKFYALPQSPQLFKQLLMMSGVDRYFQIARCFRDEDLRPNRQPEFTQLDLEASFIDEDFLYEIVEEMTVRMFALDGIDLPRPFPKMTYQAAMGRYGTDRPDLRYNMAFEDVTDILRDTRYSIFRQIIENGGRVKGFCIKGKAAVLSKNVLQNEYSLKIAPSLGAKGMTWMKVFGGRLESNIVQFFSQGEQHEIIRRFCAQEGDVIMMIADISLALVNKALCGLRLYVADRLGLIPQERYCPVWVTDFPLFELKDGNLSSQHHPFTMPDRTDFDPASKDELLALHSKAYDLVINGEELGGGSIRIHRADIQKKIFDALGLSQHELESKFGFFLKALEFGAPPHGGLALGIDRVIAMILKAPSIRQVIAFPKNRSAFCPLTGAPSRPDTRQLAELGLQAGHHTGRPLEYRGRLEQAQIEGIGPEDSQRISIAEVGYVAKLARLRLSVSEASAFQKDLDSILEYVESLRQLDTEEIQPMSHVLMAKNVWREDTPERPKNAKSILSNAPLKERGYYKVPRILEG
jgi:aspartyl-tRNA synthetase